MRASRSAERDAPQTPPTRRRRDHGARGSPGRDGERRVVSPEDLRRYDATLYDLIGRVFADHRIPADVYCGREIPNTSRTGVQNVLE